MLRLPERPSLVAQVVAVLRESLDKREWGDRLPGQRFLSQRLQVSRPTLRRALVILREEGYLRTEHGRGTRVVSAAGRAPRPAAAKLIGLLSPRPLHELSYFSLFLICDLQRRLLDAGYRLEIHTEARLHQKRPFKSLEALVRQTRAAGWILHVSTPEIQHWFSDRGLPAVVSKMRHLGVRLPAVDFDYAAMGRHAGHELCRLGHRRLGFITSREQAAGPQELEAGFRGSVRGLPPETVTLQAVDQDGTAHSIQNALSRLLASKTRPTGLLVAGAATAITALNVLNAAGLRLPRDISLVCSADDPMLEFCLPRVAHYRVNWELYGRKLTAKILQTIAAPSALPRLTRLMPDFIRGETLGPAP
jgi:DNA-binding LacI/PurR family transcriptional regulator